MKKLITFFALSIIVSTITACSSGTSVSELPSTIGGNLQQDTYNGTFRQDGLNGSGNIKFDLTENTGNITGNMILTNVPFSSCLCSSEVTGSTNGFDITLKTGVCTISRNERPSECDKPDEETGLCPLEEKDYKGDAQITLTGSGENLSGNFVVNGDVCIAVTDSNNGVFSSTGTINISR